MMNHHLELGRFVQFPAYVFLLPAVESLQWDKKSSVIWSPRCHEVLRLSLFLFIKVLDQVEIVVVMVHGIV